MLFTSTVCPVCGTPGHACGPQTTGTVTPVDIPAKENAVSGPLNEYEVEISGNKTTLQLTDEDAANFYGVGPLANKTDSAGQPDGDVDPAGDEAQAKTRTPANKSRTATNK